MNFCTGSLQNRYIYGILPKGPYPPCLRMADRAHLAGYPRYDIQHQFINLLLINMRTFAGPFFAKSLKLGTFPGPRFKSKDFPINKNCMWVLIKRKIPSDIKRLLTHAVLLCSITIVTSRTALTVEPLGVEHTPQALARRGITAAWHIRVNVIVASTSLALAALLQGITEEVFFTTVTTDTLNHNSMSVYSHTKRMILTVATFHQDNKWWIWFSMNWVNPFPAG